jgi:GDPmannose 4,6-dehydratase
LAFGRLDLRSGGHIEIDPYFYRPVEVKTLRGDYSKAREQLGWTPTTDLESLVTLMVDHDLTLAHREKER